MRIHRFLVACLLALLMLSACTNSTSNPGASSKPTVVVSFSILADLVHQVGGDTINIVSLVGPGSDAHTFEPTPNDSKALTNAQLIFENGLGFEPWLDALYKASGSKAVRVTVSQGITPLPAAEEHHQEATAAHTDTEFDPHIWQDVHNAIAITRTIADALAKADSANAAAYQKRAEETITKLEELDSFVQSKVSELPPDKRKLVTSHDTFTYFAKRYGFTIVGTALGSVTTEASEPSAAQMATLVEEIRSSGVKAIFAESGNNLGLVQTIAREAGVTLAPPLFADTLSESSGQASSYDAMMRYNVSTIVNALK